MLRSIEMDVNGAKVPMVIEIKKVYGIKPTGDFRCYFDMVLRPWGIYVYACKLFEGDKGNLWARFPARQYQTRAGESKWGPVVEIESAYLRDEIALAAREALQSM